MYSTEASRYIKKILIDLKGERDCNTKIVKGFITLLSIMDISRLDFNCASDQRGLTDVYKIFYTETIHIQVHTQLCPE